MSKDSHKAVAAMAVSGILAALTACSGAPAASPSPLPAAADPVSAPASNAGECCRGRNTCAKKGHCRVEGEHDCRARNDCRGRGGPRSGPACTDEQMEGR